MKELNEMSVLNFEGLRFPREAVKHELDAFLACCEHGRDHPRASFRPHIDDALVFMHRLECWTPPAHALIIISRHVARPERSQLVQEVSHV